MACNTVPFKQDIKFCRRFEVRLKNPNPLFEKWLEEWRLEAACQNLEIQHCYGKVSVKFLNFKYSFKH